jgi:hypothetical protein
MKTWRRFSTGGRAALVLQVDQTIERIKRPFCARLRGTAGDTDGAALQTIQER